MSLLYVFIILNVFAFLITAYDKILAVKRKKRISEDTLLTYAAIGGSIGSGIAMYLFRHKITKRYYLFKFYRIVVVQIVVLAILQNFGIIEEYYTINFK